MRSRTIGRALLVLTATAALAAGAGSASSQEGRTSGIDALLELRAEAVERGDVEAFMDTVSTLAPGRFRSRQLASITASRGVPFKSYRLIARWGRSGDLARPADVARYRDADDVAIVVVEERYRLEGVDGVPASEDLYLTLVRDDDGWGVASDSDLEDVGLLSARHLWDLGEVEVSDRGSFLVVEHPCSETTCVQASQDVLGSVEAAVDEASALWPLRWDPRVALLVPASSAELSRMLQATFEVDDFVAFAYTTSGGAERSYYGGERIVINPGAFSGRSADSTAAILEHEMMHIATRPYSGPFVPLFLEEGIAELIRFGTAPGPVAGRLPEDHEFTLSASPFEVYRLSRSVVAQLVRDHGMAEVARFYRSLGKVRTAPGTARFHLDRVMRRSLGIDPEGLVERWAGSIG